MSGVLNSGASSYSTGGGGVRLEHRYAGSLLAALLTGDPVSELGDDVMPVLVRLQASDVSPVDDVVVEGRTLDGGLRRVSIGVRRDPALTRSDERSVPLVRSFLHVVVDEWDEVRAGRQRLALVVAKSTSAVAQTSELATIAQSVRSELEFRQKVARPRATNQGVRQRLKHLDALVATAAEGESSLSVVAAGELTWRWLWALRVRQVRLEGVDEQDRTVSVTSLRRAVADESAATADALFATLAERAGGWASAGTRVDQATLRRALSGFPLRRHSSHEQGWVVLDGLSRRLREGVRPDLAQDEIRLELDRSDERVRLATATAVAGATPSCLVVTGEPDVGKTALTLRVAEQLVADGAAVVSLSLRDLPIALVDVEQLLAAPIADVLAAGEVRPLRLIVIDGAESVLEARAGLLREVATAALRAGLGVVAVTRTDGAPRVREVLQAAASMTGTPLPIEHVVSRLTQPERQALVEAFASLARLQSDSRAEWLVGRPGLVDLLLRAGTVAESTSLLSEADVFIAVWNGLVRAQEEISAGGVSPDDRERALLTVANRALGLPVAGGSPGGGVWGGLRSDGLLRVPGSAALSRGDEFATDLIRDFALCRLFLVAGWAALRDAGAPRWTIRSVRLACQAKLLSADRASAWRELRGEFDDIGAAEGERWTELPIEALLTLGDARGAIESVWDELSADNQAGLKTLLRLARQRYVHHSFGDPFALAPIVAVTFCSDRDLRQHDRYDHQGTIGSTIRDLVLEWLRGLIQHSEGPNALRQQVRDQILANDPNAHDEFAVEALATLGHDIDAATEEFLRKVAADDPYRLSPAVESVGAILSMTGNRPSLMVELAEAFYVELPDDDDDHFGSAHWEREGIRDHQAFRGLNAPLAGWLHGPFWNLLNTVPVEAIAMINRMLDHAASVRVNGPLLFQDVANDPAETFDGLDLDLAGIGLRRYIGDANVWGWYRGSTTGPYPCISALLAVERFADHLVDTLGVSTRAVVQLLLRDCHNLAMPGLVYGLLVRHLDSSGDLLDAWLTNPMLWSLEFSRTSTEGVLHVQGPDPDDLVGPARRHRTPRDVGAEIVLKAIRDGDTGRLNAATAVADQLIANARALLADDADGTDQIVVVESWASVLRPENYHAHDVAGGVVVQYEPPTPIAEALAPAAAEFTVTNDALRLQLTYASRNDASGGWPTETLQQDIALGRQLAANPPAYGPLHPEDPIAAVAAAAVRTHAAGGVVVSDDDLRWAIDTILSAALHPRVDAMSYESTTYPMGADRAAAKAVPSLLRAVFDHLDLDRTRIGEALTGLAGSLFNEVRTAFVAGAAPVWSEPCGPDALSGAACDRHALAWAAVQASLGDCRLGPWNSDTQRQPLHLPAPYTTTLLDVPAEDLRVNRLAAPIACVAAARTSECIRHEARALLPILLDTHRRGADHWMAKSYSGYEDAQRELVARVLIELTVAGDDEALAQHVQTFASNANALQHLLRDFEILFTYDDELRSVLPLVWPVVLATALDAVDAGADLRGSRHWADDAIGALLPTPQLRAGDTNPDATLDRARAGWLAAGDVEGLIDRWITLAEGEPKAADAVAQFARTSPTGWQVTGGLDWLERVIHNRYNLVANRCWFVTHWLAELRETTLNADSTSRWRRVVDGLAVAGDSRAVVLQRIDE